MAGPTFIADSPDDSSMVELDGLTACFHRPSGMTHILAAPAPQILAVLTGHPGDVSAIIDRIGAQFDIDSEDAQAAIEARLAELEVAGLVRRA